MSRTFFLNKVYFEQEGGWTEVYYRRLRDLREDHDLVQKEVAAYLDIDQRVYSTYETGKREIPVHHLIRLAILYQTSVDYMLELTDRRDAYPRSKT